MDAHLKLLADASLDVTAAEAAVADGAYRTAADRLDGAGGALAALRERWSAMSAPERALVGPAARDVRERLDAAARSVPRLTALTVASPVDDPEHDTEPL